MSAVAAFAWWAWPHADQQAILGNMDVVYQVHRVARCLLDFPHVASMDTYSHFGRAHHLHWLGPHALFYALLAKGAGVSGADYGGLVRVLSWVPPALGALAAALTAALAFSMTRRVPVALAAGLAMALSGDALVCFHHGEMDHHLFASLGLLVAALGRPRG